MPFACLEDGQTLSNEVEISDICDVETSASVQHWDGDVCWRSVASAARLHPSALEGVEQELTHTYMHICMYTRTK